MMDLEEAAAFAKKEKVRLYFISVNPRLATDALAPNRHLMRRTAKMTGGQLFLADPPESLSRVFKQIDQLEKSQLPLYQQAFLKLPKDKQPNRYRRISFYPLFIGIGMLAVASAWILAGTWLRRLP